MHKVQIDDRVRHKRDRRSGKVVEVNDTTNRARVRWDGDKRTWVRFADLVVTSRATA